MTTRAATADRGLGVALSLAALLVCGVTAVAVANNPVLAVFVALMATAGFVLMGRPELTTAAVLFVLYTNAPVVAVKFHGVPMMAAAAIPLALLLPIATNVISERRGLVLAPAIGWIALFLLVQLVGALVAPRSDVALQKVATSFVEGALLYLLIVNAVRTPEALRQVLWSLCFAGFMMGAIVGHQQVTGSYDKDYFGFGQVTQAVYTGGDEDVSEEDGQPRLAGPIGEKNRFGQIMAVLVPLAVVLHRSARNRRERWLALIAFGLSALGVATSLSRGAAVGLILGFVPLAFLGYVRLRQFGLLLAGLVFAVALVPGFMTRLLALQGAEAALGGSEARRSKQVEGTVRGRATEMAAAMLMFADHPVLGVGAGMYHHHYREYAKRAGGKVDHGGRQPHSLYLGLAAEHGVAGLGAFLGILVVTVRELLRAIRRWRSEDPVVADGIAGLLGALVVYLASAVFLHLSYARYLWLLLALAAAASALPTTRRLEQEVR